MRVYIYNKDNALMNAQQDIMKMKFRLSVNNVTLNVRVVMARQQIVPVVNYL